MSKRVEASSVAIIGGGPAGLMAAERLSQANVQVDVYEAKSSAGRKFLIAGKGGLNLTHAEPYTDFLSRYRAGRPFLEPFLNNFTPTDLRQWVHDLGFETFVGSSKRVFPADMKAAPLLRAWLNRLRGAGVQFHFRHQWLDWDDENRVCFETPQGKTAVQPDAVILALGGGSWPKLGSTGDWVSILAERGIEIAPLKPSNCGFDVGWSDYFRERFAGEAVKTVVLSFTTSQGETFSRQGEFVITETGVEGSLIYAASALLREEIEREGTAVVHLDLAPNRTQAALGKKLAQASNQSVTNRLRRIGLKGVRTALLRENVAAASFQEPHHLATAIKKCPLHLKAPRPLAEAISTAGGVGFVALNPQLMLRTIPGVFCAGEMLDWEAPTGGYLLTACLATGKAAANGVLRWLAQ